MDQGKELDSQANGNQVDNRRLQVFTGEHLDAYGKVRNKVARLATFGIGGGTEGVGRRLG